VQYGPIRRQLLTPRRFDGRLRSRRCGAQSREILMTQSCQ
jgi:hypothetical protein